MSAGLHQAGFEVVGVDIEPQPRYPFEFHQADALRFPLEGFDFIWASPPCQKHVSLRWMHNAKEHEDLIPPTRARLKSYTAPWCIENVRDAPLMRGLMLCGTMFGLGTDDAELWRHRYFELSWRLPIFGHPRCAHRKKSRVIGVYGGHGRDRRRSAAAQDFSVEDRRNAMGIDWMTGEELSQAIPPAYGLWIGREALAHLSETREAA